MPGLKSYVLGGATLVCALSIGYVMQYGFGAPRGKPLASPASVDVAAITDVSSGAAAPRVEIALRPRTSAVGGEVLDLAAASVELDASNLPGNFGAPKSQEPRPAPRAEVATPSPSCEVSLTAKPAAGALVDLAMVAPCNGSERVTIHHMGMMFTDQTDAEGNLTARVPALAEHAVFIASFASGAGATATTDVTSLSFYDRIVVQWQGPAGLQLHAREFTDTYFGEGHVWSDAMGDLANAAVGEGGFLTRLGNPSAPEALVAEIYTFPTGTAKRDGAVHLTVEAEITPQNCSKPIEAQTMELHSDSAIRVRDLVLDMPGCDTIGDFLVLKNLVEDLTIAAR